MSSTADYKFVAVIDLSMGRTNSLATSEGPTLWKSLNVCWYQGVSES